MISICIFYETTSAKKHWIDNVSRVIMDNNTMAKVHCEYRNQMCCMLDTYCMHGPIKIFHTLCFRQNPSLYSFR